MNLSLSGCGFLGIYHVGVASCFVEHAPELVKNCKVAGASAGALAGCLLVCDDIDLRECTEDVLEIVIRARSHALGPLHPSFNVTKILRDGFRKVLPKDAHKSASGRLFVSLTRLSDCSNVIVSEFETREDLIQVLLCSAFVPLYSGLIPPSYKGVRYVDGGLSNNSPCCSDADSTITVSPFSGESDICPPTDDTSNYLHMNLANTSIQLTPSNLYRLSRALFPPEPEIMTRMCRRGFQDALQFLKHRGLVSCNRHLSLRSLSEVHIHDDISLSGDDDDEDSLIEETQHCTDCQERKQEVDLIDNLPKPVLEAFQSASASVNDSRLAWIVSYATLPYVLPLETLYSFLSRFIDWLPYLPSDLQAFVYFLWHIAKHIVKHVESERHQYSARFSCQLAITESEIHQEGFEIFTEEELRNVRFNFNLGIQESQDGRQVRWQIGEDELRLCSDDSDENDNDLCNVEQHLTSVIDSSDVDNIIEKMADNQHLQQSVNSLL